MLKCISNNTILYFIPVCMIYFFVLSFERCISSCNFVDIIVFGVFLFMFCLIIIEVIPYSFLSLPGCLQSKCFLQLLFVQLTSWSYIPCFFFFLIMDLFFFPITFQAFLTFKISIEKAATILINLLLCVTYLMVPLLLLSLFCIFTGLIMI